MNILVLGGTGFLGPEIVDTLLANKHKVTLFNRGRSQKDLFPDVEKLIGDRANDLKALQGRTWDAVVDVHASQPKWVKATCELLAKSVGTYAFVSTISVFNDYAQSDIAEDGPTFPIDPKLDTLDRLTNETYGPMKMRSETIVQDYFPKTATIVRPGLIVGPTDPTDRFTYWPVRVDRGGEVLAPGDGKDAVQFVDVRDLGNFIPKLIEDGHAGVYNATGPAGGLTMAEFLHGCKAATSSDVWFTWADAQWLLENNVQPFMELPLWAPGEEMRGFMRINCRKARDVGLTFRPLAETARDTIAWARQRQGAYQWQAGLDSQKEAELALKWRNRPRPIPMPKG